MMDLFADALSSDDSQPLLSKALSQAKTSFDAQPIVLSDGEEDSNPGTNKLQVPVDANTPPPKRRKVAEKLPQLHEVPAMGANEVMCVFVQREKKALFLCPCGINTL